MANFQHPIQVVARLTGLTPHVIRVWEKRYQAVVPTRTGTNRRLYSDAEVDRLRLLAQATSVGHKIGIIAKLETEDLRRLVATVGVAVARESGTATGATNTVGRGSSRSEGSLATSMALAEHRQSVVPPSSRAWDDDGEFLKLAIAATMSFDAESLRGVLEKTALRFGHCGVLHRLVCPLAVELGERWQQGMMTAAHEHFASALIRDFLSNLARPYSASSNAPCAVVTTPAGQLHELGAVIVAAAASHWGWRTVYLGASLPAAEIAGAAIQNRAKAVLLSVVYPADDASLPGELIQLRQYLPSDAEIFLGGRAARAYAPALKDTRVHLPSDLESLGERMEELRYSRFGA